MSLGGSGSKQGSCSSSGFTGSDSYHRAICNATHEGVVFAVAAGNSGTDAQGFVPAVAYDDTVITASATQLTGDLKQDWPSWSNWGDGHTGGDATLAAAPVGIAGLGVNVLSTCYNGGTCTKSGTSMASPHLAGTVALFLQGADRAPPIPRSPIRAPRCWARRRAPTTPAASSTAAAIRTTSLF